MNRRRIAALLLCFLPLVFLLASCGGRALSPEEEALCGRWAYSHDPKTAVLTLTKNGRAKFEGGDYSFTCDGEYIRLSAGKSGTVSLRYRADDKGMTLYLPAEYESDEAADGLVGLWKCPEKNWSFAFTEEGTFTEDGNFTGNYTVDGEAGSFTLVYAESFGLDDALCFYSLDGGSLTVEYPWPMVRMK